MGRSQSPRMIYKDLKLFAKLVQEGNYFASAKWLLLSSLGIEQTVAVRVQSTDLQIRTATPDAQVALSCLRGEFDEVIHAIPTLKHGVIIDAGGYIGSAAMVFAEAYPDAIVISLEPSPANFEILQRNTSRFANVRALNKALAATSSNKILRDRGTGAWGLTVVNGPLDSPHAAGLAEVMCTTVEDILNSLGKTGVDILKLDIEGGEYELLRSPHPWMTETTAVCIELHDRIVAGCTDAFIAATAGRRNRKLAGEKYLSLA